MNDTTDSATVITGEITADDIKALKAAECVSFHYYDGRGFIKASLRNRDGRIYTAKEQTLFNTADRYERERHLDVKTDMFGYGRGHDDDRVSGWSLAGNPGASAFTMIHTPDYNDEWWTIVALLKAGDVLTLKWVADNNTEIVDKAGMHADSLSLVVSRPGKTQPVRFTFRVRNEIGYDNSARMIKRHGG